GGRQVAPVEFPFALGDELAALLDFESRLRLGQSAERAVEGQLVLLRVDFDQYIAFGDDAPRFQRGMHLYDAPRDFWIYLDFARGADDAVGLDFTVQPAALDREDL